MKRTVLIVGVLSLLSYGMIDSAKQNDNNCTWEQLQEEERLFKEAELKRIEKHREDELKRFLQDIGHRESGNRYHVTNTLGYMGKYQFGKSTLRGLGFDVTRKEFLNNPQLQEEAMMALLQHNKRKLQKYIDIFNGKTVNGNKITESGILAAAHLGGAGSVKRFFKSGRVFKDAYGTRITSYMVEFSGYDIHIK